jgi:hypothetical protein
MIWNTEEGVPLPADACDQYVFSWDEAGCLHFMPAHFLFRTKW